jgi:hypothetical protein
MPRQRDHTSKFCYSNGCRRPECRERWRQYYAEYRTKNQERINQQARERRERA